MVGVPGRSKGCHTCRARKKGCDLQRPYCGQCVKGNFICRGYRREVTFIQHDQSGPGTADEAATDQSSARRLSNNPLTRRTAARPSHVFDPLPEDLNRTAFEVKFFSLFWDLYLPKGQELPSDSHSSTVAEWAEVVQDLSPGHDALRSALLAVSVARIGRSNEDTSMIGKGMELYGKALCQINRALRDPNQAQRDELVAACRLLSFYEQFNASYPSKITDRLSQARNWQYHVQGLGKLIEFRGPRKHSSKYGHKIFVEARMSGVILAITNRKATFLSKPEWSVVPWRATQKTIRDKLMDIMVLLPHICEEFDKIKSCESTSQAAQRGQSLIGKCWKLDDFLQKWYRKFIFQLSRHFQAAQLLPMIQAVNTASDEISPEAFYRQGFEVLHTAVLYWTICTVLYSTMRIMFQRFPGFSPDGSFTVLPASTDPRKYAIYIMRSIKYFLQPEAGLHSVQNVSFPLGVSLHYLAEANESPTEEYSSFVELMREATKTPAGSWISGFLTGLQRNSVPKTGQTIADGYSGTRARARTWYGSNTRPQSSLTREQNPNVQLSSGENSMATGLADLC